MANESQIEGLDLKEQLRSVLEEARMVLPGVQALFGFQLISVFSPGFLRELTEDEQKLHLLAISWCVLAIACAIAPAAFHRQKEKDQASDSLVRLGGRFLAWSLAFVICAMVLDFYVLARVLTQDRGFALLSSIGVAVVLTILWFVAPRLRKVAGK